MKTKSNVIYLNANSVKITATVAQIPKNHHESVKSSLESLFIKIIPFYFSLVLLAQTKTDLSISVKLFQMDHV